MRGLIFVTWIFGLIHFANAANFYAHVHERIWLYEMYDLFCDIEGPDKQNKLFPQRKKGGHAGHRNIGTGSGTRLTYSEFQWRMNGGTLGQGLPPPTLADPRVDIGKAGLDLLANKMSGNVPIEAMDKSFMSWKADPKDPDAEKYAAFIDKIEKQYSTYRGDEKYASHFTTERKERFDELGRRIVRLRQLDSANWVKEHFKRPVNKGGLGITDADIIKEDTGMDGYKDKFEKLNVPDTLAKYTNADGTLKAPLSQSFDSAQDVIEWIDQQGDPNSDWEYSKESRSHFRTIGSWRTFEAKQALPADKLKSCGL